MPKVIIDTNVFISSILFGGNPRKITDLWLAQKFTLCLSPQLKAEILIKCKQKFALPLSTLNIIEKSLDEYSHRYLPQNKVTLCADPQDNFLLELTEEAKADYLITGDKALLHLKTHLSTQILSPAKFLNL
jgi:putative PIN family toxin of toxin-antitoxin system